MPNPPNTRPSAATRAEEERDANTPAGAQPEQDSPEPSTDEVSPDVATHYEEMTELGADQRGEGRMP
jgi:hypothetical protein